MDPAQRATIEPAASLVPACLAGDRRAQDTLARWCLPRVRRTVMLSHGPGADADDLVQVAMTRVFSGLGSYRGEAGFYVWVDRVTINVVRDHFRKRSMFFLTRDDDDLADRQEAPVHTPEQELGRARLMERLATHFASLPKRRRVPLVLALAHGYTVPEIAAMLDLSPDAAKKLVQRGRRQLLGRLKKDPYCREVLGELGR